MFLLHIHESGRLVAVHSRPTNNHMSSVFMKLHHAKVLNGLYSQYAFG